MLEFTTNGKLNIWDNYYDIITINRKGQLVLEVTNKSSIYYADHKTKRITRNISKKGTISLEGNTLNVMNVTGVAFHLNEMKKEA